MTGKIFIISAPCGAGKSSLVSAVIEELQQDIPVEQVITYTTRSPRQNEENGRDYHFIDRDEFERRIKDDFFIEWSNAYTAYYGSPRSIVEDCKKGRSFMIILDRAGAEQVIQKAPEVVLIWIEVSSITQLKERLIRRATENIEHIQKRLERSKFEIALEHREPLYHYKIINDDFGTAKLQLMTIVMHELHSDAMKKEVVESR